MLLDTRDRDSQLLESSPRLRFLGIRTLHVSMSYPSRQPHGKLISGLSPFPRHHEKYSRGANINGRTALVLTESGGMRTLRRVWTSKRAGSIRISHHPAPRPGPEFSQVRGHSVGHLGSMYRMVNIDLVPFLSMLRIMSRDFTFLRISHKHVRICVI